MKLFDNVKAALSLVPAVYTSSQAYGSAAVLAVDTLGYREGMLVVPAGNLVTVDETYEVQVWECDTTGGTYVDTGIKANPVADNTLLVARISELNVVRKRFLKTVLVIAGSNESFPGAGVILLSDAYAGPINTD
jgi:hypothetical protein